MRGLLANLEDVIETALEQFTILRHLWSIFAPALAFFGIQGLDVLLSLLHE